MASAEITVRAAVDKIDDLSDRDADTTDSDLRYMAYGARLRTALRAASRYVAYVRELLSVIRTDNTIPLFSRRATSAKHFDL